ncbi:putative MFS family arabinose efflux permease [Amorphus suaedae]
MNTSPADQPPKPAGAPVPGAFAPFRHQVFAILWTATVLGNMGTFVRDVASQWIVSGLTPSPAAVGLIQAAGTLPIFLLAIPSGVLSDILDRRRFLIAVQIGLACVSFSLATLASLSALSVSSLVLLTFLGGVGAALTMPAWQAVVPELVPRPDLKSAVALNSLGINIARALGPALGGFALAMLGAAATYGIDVLTYFVVIGALLWWKRPAQKDDTLHERFHGALRAGLRYTIASREMHRLLWRAAVFFLFGSAVWALLPLVARRELAGGPGFYGVMLGSIGLGAIAGALLLPRLRARLGQDRLVLAASLVTALCCMLLALTGAKAVALAATFVLGMAWITVLVTLNATMQSILPDWVRGRGLAVYLTVFNGAMAAGSLGWGLVGEASSVPVALLIAAAGLAVTALIVYRAALPSGEDDLSPSSHWPEPSVVTAPSDDRGPVLITITYEIAPDDVADFVRALTRLSSQRRRDGAYAWGVSEDPAAPGKVVEWFFVSSWAEHLRQHRRVSRAAADLQAEATVFHRGAVAPEVRHLIALDPSAER